MKRLWFLIVMIIVTNFSCKKEEGLIHATIIYSGPIAADGCEWLLWVDNTTGYSPVNLDTAFMIDHLEVLVAFDVTGDSFICGWAKKHPVISIKEMENH